jgi:hypothetical protein
MVKSSVPLIAAELVGMHVLGRSDINTSAASTNFAGAAAFECKFGAGETLSPSVSGGQAGQAVF